MQLSKAAHWQSCNIDHKTGLAKFPNVLTILPYKVIFYLGLIARILIQLKWVWDTLRQH